MKVTENYSSYQSPFYSIHLLEEDLASWCKKAPLSELNDREKAAGRIKQCYALGNKKLNLSLFTRITSLLPEIGQLEKLEILDLAHTPITSLPQEIGLLSRLEELHLLGTQITSLPQEIQLLFQLKKLHLSYTPITSLLPEIGQLEMLEILDLAHTRITSLLPEIGQLEKLEILDLAHTSITSLPQEIGRLSQLRTLDLSYTPITSLPEELFLLPRICNVELTGCPISDRVLDHIRQITSSPDYRGPRISYSMYERQEGDTRNLEEVLSSLYSLLSKPQTDLSHISQNPNLAIWLKRLSDTADFKRGGEAKIRLVATAIEYMEYAEANLFFRKSFSHIIEDAATTCGDRVALSVLHLGLAYQLETFDLKQTNQLAEFLIHTVWAIDQLERFARNKVDCSRFCDEIEVYLGYIIPLKKELDLKINVEEMLYFRCSNITKEEIEVAKTDILSLRDSNQKYEFLIGQDIWLKALREKYPDRYPNISLEEEGCEIAREQRLIELTKEALV